jgi:hypothetical protein
MGVGPVRYSDSEIFHILHELGFADLRSSGGIIKARCGCSNKDDRTFVVINGDPPGYHCHRCKRSGAIPSLVWEEWFKGRSNILKSMLIVSAHHQAWMFEEGTVSPTRLEYIPLADKPGIKKLERQTDGDTRRPIYGSQLSLEGKAVIEHAKPIDESDLDKFKLQASSYLSARGLSEGTQWAYNVRVNPWGHRVVFPIRDWTGTLVGASQRRTYEGPNCPKCGADVGSGHDMKYKCACGTINAKYLHSKGFKKSAVLYGEHLYTPGCVPVIVEGMTDVLNLYENGLRPPVALPLAVMGGSAVESQVRRLLDRFPTGPVFVIRDHDDPSKYKDLPPGKGPGDLMAEGLEAAIRMLAPGRSVVHVIPPLGSDPGDLTPAAAKIVIDAICAGQEGIVHL